MFPYVQFVPIAISIVILLCRRGSAAGHAQDGGGHHSQRAREERSQEDARWNSSGALVVWIWNVTPSKVNIFGWHNQHSVRLLWRFQRVGQNCEQAKEREVPWLWHQVTLFKLVPEINPFSPAPRVARVGGLQPRLGSRRVLSPARRRTRGRGTPTSPPWRRRTSLSLGWSLSLLADSPPLYPSTHSPRTCLSGCLTSTSLEV